MPAKYYLEVTQLLRNKIGNNFQLSKNGDLSYKEKDLDKSYLGENFYICRDGKNYQIKRRSKTNNPHIIFDLRYKGLHKTDGIEQLKKFIIKIINKKLQF